MCMGGSTPDIPPAIQYAAVKTPNRETGGRSDEDERRRRAAAATKTSYASTNAPASTQMKTLIGT